jgi:hypothetical protein
MTRQYRVERLRDGRIRVYIETKDGWVFRHFKTYQDYKKAKEGKNDKS